jgi:YidC/Oxa1 family membrane protein insertase
VVRLVFFPLANKSFESMSKMKKIQPMVEELKKKFEKDQTKLQQETMALYQREKINPLMGCLPMLVQIPVFLGLYHVLRCFNRTSTGIGQLGLSPERNRELGNYVFSVADVNHFLNANLFGAPIGASMTQRGASLEAFSEFSRPAVAAVGVPVMILAGIATYFNSRASVARQSVEAAANPQTAMMNKLALYVFPLGVVVGGPFLPLAIIFYWFANNIWTFGQQHYVFRMIEREDEEKKREAIERRSANAPAPGAKPKRSARNASAGGNGSSATDAAEGNGVAADSSEVSDPVSRAPRPGAKPKKRRR